MNRDLLLRRGWTLPLLLSLFVDQIHGTPIRAAALLSILAWAAWTIRRAGRVPAFPPALIFFLLWGAAGLSFSAYRAGTLAELTLLSGAVALWAGASALWKVHPEEKEFFHRALLVLALFKAVTVLLSPTDGGRLILDPGDDWVANVSLLAMFFCLVLVAVRPPADKAWRAAWALLAAASVWFCVRWNAMAALLGLAAGVPLAEAFRRRSAAFFGGAVAAALVTLAVLFSPLAPRRFQYNPGDPGRFERLVIWRDSFAYARAHVWTGTGLGTFEQHYPRFKTLPALKTANHAHNEWLQLLVETGLPGLTLALLLLLGLLRGSMDKARGAPGAAAGVAMLFLWSLLYYPFRSDALLFAGAMLLASLSRSRPLPLGKGLGWALAAPALLVAGAALSQGVAQTIEWRGGAAWNAGDTGTALARFRLASRLDPWEPRLLMHQVECLRRLERKEETLPLLEKALDLKPRDIWIRRKLAAARLHLVGIEAARDTYAPILDLAPNVEQFRREYEDLSPPKR